MFVTPLKRLPTLITRSVLYMFHMIILEVAGSITKFINDDGDYMLSFDDTGEIFPMTLDMSPAPVDYDDSELPF